MDFTLENQINRWINRNPEHIFTDANGIEVKLIAADNGFLTYQTPISPTKTKLLQSITIGNKHLNAFNAEDTLSSATQFSCKMESAVDIGIYNAKKKIKEQNIIFNQDKDPFKIVDIKKTNENYRVEFVIENKQGEQKVLPITDIFYQNKRLGQYSFAQYVDQMEQFHTFVPFKQPIEKAEEWLKTHHKIVLDATENAFVVKAILPSRTSSGTRSILFEDKDGKTIERVMSAIKFNGTNISSKNIMEFLTNCTKIENKFSPNRKSKAQNPLEKSYMPNMEDVHIGTGLRLCNGQCAKVFDTHESINDAGSKVKTIDIIVEDGTIIQGVSKHRLSSGLLNINKNSPILNKCKNKPEQINEVANNHFKAIIKAKTGVSSMTELAYMKYLSELGFQETNQSFLKNYFNISDRRFPDGFLLKDKKMVIFEYDGYGGHGHIKSDNRDNIGKDHKKNELYQSIVDKAKNGDFLPNISDVLIIRVRGTNVPFLYPENISEISETKSKNFTEAIESTLLSITEIMDKRFNWNTTKELENIILQSFISIQVPTKSTDVFEVSKMIGCGTINDRCGQYAAIQQPKQSKKQHLPHDKVEVFFETGEKVFSTYEKFISGNIKNSNGIKVYNLQKDEDNKTHKQYRKMLASPTITHEEIDIIRDAYPLQDGTPISKQPEKAFFGSNTANVQPLQYDKVKAPNIETANPSSPQQNISDTILNNDNEFRFISLYNRPQNNEQYKHEILDIEI